MSKEFNQKNCNIAENAFEIAEQVIEQLQERFPETSRSDIFETYIYPWAIEAEDLFSSIDEDYYDFIDKFAKNKIDDLNKEGYEKI